MTDTSRHSTTRPDDKRTSSLKAFVRTLARASARQFVSDFELKLSEMDQVDQPLAATEDQK